MDDESKKPDVGTAGSLGEDAIKQAREQEETHRALQQQGSADGDDRPPAQRERDEAVDHAIEDVERVEREAAERRRRSAEAGDS